MKSTDNKNDEPFFEIPRNLTIPGDLPSVGPLSGKQLQHPDTPTECLGFRTLSNPLHLRDEGNRPAAKVNDAQDLQSLPQNLRTLGPVPRDRHRLPWKTAALPPVPLSRSQCVGIFFTQSTHTVMGKLRLREAQDLIPTTWPRYGPCLVSGALSRALCLLVSISGSKMRCHQ